MTNLPKRIKPKLRDIDTKEIVTEVSNFEVYTHTDETDKHRFTYTLTIKGYSLPLNGKSYILQISEKVKRKGNLSLIHLEQDESLFDTRFDDPACLTSDKWLRNL